MVSTSAFFSHDKSFLESSVSGLGFLCGSNSGGLMSDILWEFEKNEAEKRERRMRGKLIKRNQHEADWN
jgi:hypothetical protein